MRILALDLGERRIGVALSDVLGFLATPLTVVQSTNRKAALAAIEHLVYEHEVERVVVGYPRSMDGTVGRQAQLVDRYVEKLCARLQGADGRRTVPVILWDERLSTALAHRLIHEAGNRVQRDRIDAAAAAVILQSYLDSQSAGAQGGTT